MRQSISVVSALAIASCNLSPKPFNQSLAEADKECAARVDWPNFVSKVSCYDTVEEPIIRQKVPVALSAFQRFSERRRYLAGQADIINAKGIEQTAKYRSLHAEAYAVLKAQEPKLADINSTLYKEMFAAKAQSVCLRETLTEQVNCIGNILRPMWERDAPETLAYFNEYEQKELGFARDVDASGAPETNKRAAEYLTTGMKQAVAEFRENAQRDIAAANAQDAAARQRAQQAFGEIVAGIALVSLAVAAGAAMAAYAPPVYYVPSANAAPPHNLQAHCTTNYINNFAYTNCY
jgi:hypothetical protein